MQCLQVLQWSTVCQNHKNGFCSIEFNPMLMRQSIASTILHIVLAGKRLWPVPLIICCCRKLLYTIWRLVSWSIPCSRDDWKSNCNVFDGGSAISTINIRRWLWWFHTSQCHHWRLVLLNETCHEHECRIEPDHAIWLVCQEMLLLLVLDHWESMRESSLWTTSKQDNRWVKEPYLAKLWQWRDVSSQLNQPCSRNGCRVSLDCMHVHKAANQVEFTMNIQHQ